MKEVTLKFYSVDERLPKKSGKYLVKTDYKNTTVLSYSLKHQLFNTRDKASEKSAKLTAIDVQYWAELPNL